MKILIEAHQYFSPYKTGVGYYESILIEQIKKAYPEIEITLGIFSDTDQRPVSYPVEKSRYKRKVLLKLHVYGIRLFSEKIWKGDYDAYIYPDFVAFPSKKAKVSVTVHDLTYLLFPDFLPGERNKLLNAFWPSLAGFLRRTVPKSIIISDVVLATSNSVAEELVENYSVLKEKIVVSGIPTFSNNEDEDKKILERITTEKYFYIQGTIEPRKNILVALRAYSDLDIKTRKKYSLVIAGKAGWKSDEVLNTIKTMINSGENVVLLDYITDQEKTSLYKNASLYIQPSHYEGFGMPLLEAMSYSLPIVCSDIPVFREVCDNSAVYFNKDSSGSLKEAILNTINSENLKKEMIKNGQARLTHYNNDLSGIKSLLNKLS